MKGLTLLALVGFVLAISLAVPFTEEETKAHITELGEIGNDITQSNLESDDDNEYYNKGDVDSDNNEEDEGDQDEDEDDDDNDEGERQRSLSNPMQQSNDPWSFLPRVLRRARRIFRRLRRRRSRRRRGGRRFRRRRGRG